MDKVLIYDVIDNSVLIPYYQIDCLHQNSDHNILPISVYNKDCHTIMETDITGMTSLGLLTDKISLTRISTIHTLLSFGKCLNWCIDHFLDPHGLKCTISDFYLLESDADLCSNDIYFRYVPVVGTTTLSDPIESLFNELFRVSLDGKDLNEYFTDSEVSVLSGWNLDNLAEVIELIGNFPENIDLNSKISTIHNDVMPDLSEACSKNCKANSSSSPQNSSGSHSFGSLLSKFQFTPFVIVATLVVEFLLILLSFIILRNQNMFTNRYLPVFYVALILIFCALADLILLFNPSSPIRILSDSVPYPIDPQDCNLFSITEEKTTLLQRSADKNRIAMLCNGIPGTPQESLGQKAYILVDDFLVGRDGVKVDFKISSLSVGRLHARITRRENSFFIEDLDSRNGTYIDELKIKKKQDYLLPEKCKIRFADQVFYFVAT